MPQLMPPPPMPYYEDFAKGWYLRGDIGMSNQKVGSLFNALYDTADSVENVFKDFDSAPIFGLGVGYQFNNWLRADVTGEYRGKANFHGYDIVTSAATHSRTNIAPTSRNGWCSPTSMPISARGARSRRSSASASAARATRSATSWTSARPARAAASRTAARRRNSTSPGRLTPASPTRSRTTSPLEFAYRYVDLGDALTGDLVTYLGQNNVNNPMHFRNITSHDFKFGVRWFLDSGPKYEPMPSYPPPLMRRG